MSKKGMIYPGNLWGIPNFFHKLDGIIPIKDACAIINEIMAECNIDVLSTTTAASGVAAWRWHHYTIVLKDEVGTIGIATCRAPRTITISRSTSRWESIDFDVADPNSIDHMKKWIIDGIK